MRTDARQRIRVASLCAGAAFLLGACAALSICGSASATASRPASHGASQGAVRGCGSFHGQAAAEEYFLAHGGAPRRPVGHLDPDRDGVACEGLAGPYAGYATVGYNRSKSFFYGTVAMPPLAGGGGFACLKGDTHFPEDPRRFNLFRERRGRDRGLLGEYGRGAAADPSTGRLVWKVPRALAPGHYYVVFEESTSTSPYRRTECPSFRSPSVRLPPPRRAHGAAS
jgi:hypothetical protein